MKDQAAFPAPVFAVPKDFSGDQVILLKNQQGMTLRDYFAAKAMTAILTLPATDPHAHQAWVDECAKMAYMAADAMLKERDK